MEEILPPQTESGAGFEPPRVRQFTIFMENRVGRLQAVVRAQEEAGGRVMSLSIQESADNALIRMICADADLGREILQRDKLSFTEQDTLVVELPKRNKQPLTSICAALLAAEINIYYAYPLLIGPGGPALVLYVDDPVLAAQLLIKKGFAIIGESDLRK